MEPIQQSIRLMHDDQMNMRTIRYFMRRRGARREAPTVTEMVRFALEYSANAIRAARKGEDTVRPPVVSELSGSLPEEGEE